MRVRLDRALAPSLCLCLASTALLATSEATLDRLEFEIRSRYKEVTPSAVIQIIGVPQDTAERDGAEFLTWQASKQSGSFASGFGTARTHECRATFEFRNQKLTSVSLAGTSRADRTLCKKLVDPLLRNAPRAESSPSGPPFTPPQVEATSERLTNVEIVKLTKAKLMDDVIIAKIKASWCSFDLSTDGLIALKEAGVSDRVIQAMMEASIKTM